MNLVFNYNKKPETKNIFGPEKRLRFPTKGYCKKIVHPVSLLYSHVGPTRCDGIEEGRSELLTITM